MATDGSATHPGGGFNPPEPTTRGGPDYGRFIAAVRDLQDHARAVDAPDDVITKAADLLEDMSLLLAPYDADEWTSPSGRRFDLPSRGSLLPVPMDVRKDPDGRVRGTARFRRFHLGRNGAAHGGAIGLLFDSLLGTASVLVTENRYQRTAYLHLDYRSIVPIEKELQVEAWVRSIEGRKIFVVVRLSDGEELLTEGEALFVQLKAGATVKEQIKKLPRKWGRQRDKLRERPAANLTYRIVVGVVGLAVLAVGIAAIPYPGPGWAIVFLGLGILATEFEWAHTLLHYARERYDAVMDWFKRQGLWVQILGALFTAAVVLVSLWLFGALSWTAGLVGLDWPWLQSPIGIGS